MIASTEGHRREHRLRIGDRDVVLVEGAAGWGECSPWPGYPCDPFMARAAAEDSADTPWPPALRQVVPVNALVGDGALSAGALDGFSTVKVKVGRPRRQDDLARVSEVRELVGPTVALRVDANGAWDLETAVEMLTALASNELELAEQPVACLEDLAVLRRRVRVPIAADECVRTIEDARRLRAMDAADAVVLKVQPLGGVRAALAVAEAAGVPAIVTSMLETSVGLAAGVALAAALPTLPYACGLATLGSIGGDVTHTPLVPRSGSLEVRRVAPDRDLLERYAVTS